MNDISNVKNLNNDASTLINEPVVAPSPTVPPQQNIPTPVREVPSNSLDAVCLALQLYNSIRVLNFLYQQMRSISQSHQIEMENLIKENALLQNEVLNIYYSLSGSNVSPRTNLVVPSLGNNFCSGLEVISRNLQEVLKQNELLKQNVNTQNLSKQIAAVNSGLTSQNNQINNMKKNC